MSEPTPYSIDRLEQLAGSGFVVPPNNEDAKVISFLCRDWRNRHAPDKGPEGFPCSPHARCLCGCERQDHRVFDEACPILPSDGPVLHFYEGKVWRPAK